MIVPMKKVALLCLATEKVAALKELRSLGLMHLHENNLLTHSEDRSELESEIARMQKNLAALDSIREKGSENKEFSGRTAADLFKTLDTLLEQRHELEKQLDELRRQYEQLEVWGDFSQEALSQIKNGGLFVYLCQGSDKDIEAMHEEARSAVMKVIGEARNCKYFVLINRTPLDEKTLPLSPQPDTALTVSEIAELIGKHEDELLQLHEKLCGLKLHSPELHDFLRQEVAEQKFLEARDMMASHEEISVINGFVPVPEIARLTDAAHQHGWALQIQEPAPDERVPTLLREPKIFRFVRPIFDFIGISPGYDEQDVSICFLFFFTIFFGMIVGDAGYGMLFLLCTALAAFLQRKTLKTDRKARRKITLFFVLSSATVIWGALTGTYFGIASDKLPTFMRGIKTFSDPAVKDKNVQYLCFLLAAIHLSIGRLWQALLNLKNRKFFGEIGWALLLWGNFFTAVYLIIDPSSYPKAALVLYAVGLLLVLSCGVNWKDVGDVFNFPFGVIGCFVDVLSYIRLFAVGMATFYIAKSFNDMGSMVMGIPLPWYLFPILVLFAIIVILFGHALNIALAFMGVLVHGIRLNTLEFSNHMGLRWSGFSFRAFKREDD